MMQLAETGEILSILSAAGVEVATQVDPAWMRWRTDRAAGFNHDDEGSGFVHQ